jgi:hypothetical protein
VEETAVYNPQPHHAQPGQNGIQHQCLGHKDVAETRDVKQQLGGGKGRVRYGRGEEQSFGG